MADTYAYKVRDRAGKVLSGTLEADSTKLVAERLRSMGYVPIAIDKKSQTGMKKELTIPGFSNGLDIGKELFASGMPWFDSPLKECALISTVALAGIETSRSPEWLVNRYSPL